MSVSSSYQINSADLNYALEQLSSFVAIPSVSNPYADYYSMENLQRAADFTADRFKEIGFEVRQVSIDGSAPYVLAQKIVDVALPTLLFYAHYDVMPVEEAKWKTPPFVLTIIDGRAFARGASDDKAGVIVTSTALALYLREYGIFPCNIKFLSEGEEEYGSKHMEALVEQEKAFLKADALVVLDGGNLDSETGTLTASTRGILNLNLSVKTMEKPTHSGVGCLVPDPSAIMAELMVSVKDPRKIPGFMDTCHFLNETEIQLLNESSQTAEAYASDHNLLNNVRLRGDPNSSVYSRIAEEPSISFVNGRWGISHGGNSIQECANCEVGVRVTAGQDPNKVAEALKNYLLAQDVQGAEVTITQNEAGSHAWKGDLSGPFTQKYLSALGEVFKTTHVQPCGGALPFLHTFTKISPDMEIIIPGVEDPKCAAHSHNESQDIALFGNAINSVIAFLKRIADDQK